MIQRIQTVYLFVTAVLAGLLFAFPSAEFLSGNNMAELTAAGFFDSETGKMILFPYGLAATAGASALLALVTLFLYKKRMAQLRLCIVEMVLLVGTLLFEIYYIWGGVKSIGNAAELYSYAVRLPSVFPVIALIFSWLALRGVNKDIMLLRSLDRIR